MFTGIVEEVGTVVAAEAGGDGSRLTIAAPVLAALAAVGDSISVAGCCLTVVERDGDRLRFEATPETLARTALSNLRPGVRVNLEDALRAGEPLGGHLVQGHVDDVGRVASLEPAGIGHTLRVEAPPTLMRYVVEKGSIVVDGISLTITACDVAGFEIAVIPHTWAVTTLADRHVGDDVNLEVDVLAKYVERLLGDRAAPTA